MRISDLTLPGDHALTARLYEPPEPRAVAVMNGATGIPMRHYDGFAQWMAGQMNIACLTYDYRDFGASARGDIRASVATMADWGVGDQQVARDWLADSFPSHPLWVIGHSLGGIAFGWQTGLDRIDQIVTAGAGDAHIGDHPWPTRAMAASLWWGHGAALTRIKGYLPGRLSGLGGPDLPAGVYRQWRRWCTTHGFIAADPAMPSPSLKGLRAQVRVIGLSDDTMVPRAAVDRLAARMGPNVERVELSPQEAGLAAVGHSGIFSRRSAPLWPLMFRGL